MARSPFEGHPNPDNPFDFAPRSALPPAGSTSGVPVPGTPVRVPNSVSRLPASDRAGHLDWLRNQMYGGRTDAQYETWKSRGLSPSTRSAIESQMEKAFRPKLWTKAAWSSNEIRMRAIRGLRTGGLGVGFGINMAFAPALIGGGAVREAANWGTKTGYQEDYVGGFVYGARSGTGEALGGLVGELAGSLLGAPLGPGGVLIFGLGGAFLGGPVGKLLFNRYAYEKGRLASSMTAGAIAKRKVQFGRGFVDSQEAYTMRQTAIQEMAGSLLNARQYLANEAYFMHR